MIMIKISAESNGAHASQRTSNNITPPDGWAAIPADLEAIALPLLPWVKLTIAGETVTDVEDDAEARAAWETVQAEIPQPVDDLTQLQLALAEIAEAQAADQTATELALAELAELITGGAD